MRLSHSFTAAEIVKRTGFSQSTISRYERGRLSFERVSLDFLERYAEACGENRFAAYSNYHIFRKFHRQILTDYLAENGIKRTELGDRVGVSRPLATSWVDLDSRCPSYELWKREFEEFTRGWIDRYPDLFI